MTKQPWYSWKVINNLEILERIIIAAWERAGLEDETGRWISVLDKGTASAQKASLEPVNFMAVHAAPLQSGTCLLQPLSTALRQQHPATSMIASKICTSQFKFFTWLNFVKLNHLQPHYHLLTNFVARTQEGTLSQLLRLAKAHQMQIWRKSQLLQLLLSC